jgi:hypothetical protein
MTLIEPTQPAPSHQPAARTRYVVGAIALALGLQALVFGLIFPHLGYPLHLFTDVPNDFHYAHDIILGREPYRNFTPEYPPLALWLVSPPALHLLGTRLGFIVYQRRFALEMFLLSLLTVGIIVAASARLWPDRPRKSLLAAVSAALFVLAIGPLIENRFDVGVALVTALALYALAKRHVVLAGLCIGVGFAFKVTPALLLPLVVLVAGWNRKTLAVLALFAAGAVAPFLPYLNAIPGLRQMFFYQTNRPLEFESVLGLPSILDHLISGAALGRGVSHHSWSMLAPWADTAAKLSTPLVGAALTIVVLLLIRRRETLRQMPRSLALASVALYLAFLCFDKVLSPQYMIWLLPAAALLLLDDLWLGGLVLVSTALTQMEFPVLWSGILQLQAGDLAWLCARNILLLASFGLSLWRLWRLPAWESAPAARELTPTLSAEQTANDQVGSRLFA